MRLVKRFKSSIIMCIISIILYLCWQGYASPIVLKVIELFVGMDVDKAMEIACNNADLFGIIFLVLFIIAIIVTFITIIRNIISPSTEEETDE